MAAANGLAQQEAALESSADKLIKIKLIQQQLIYQNLAVKEGAEKFLDIKEQVNSMERWEIFQRLNDWELKN